MADAAYEALLAVVKELDAAIILGEAEEIAGATAMLRSLIPPPQTPISKLELRDITALVPKENRAQVGHVLAATEAAVNAAKTLALQAQTSGVLDLKDSAALVISLVSDKESAQQGSLEAAENVV
jgi:hypothetical protein